MLSISRGYDSIHSKTREASQIVQCCGLNEPPPLVHREDWVPRVVVRWHPWNFKRQAQGKILRHRDKALEQCCRTSISSSSSLCPDSRGDCCLMCHSRQKPNKWGCPLLHLWLQEVETSVLVTGIVRVAGSSPRCSSSGQCQAPCCGPSDCPLSLRVLSSAVLLQCRNQVPFLVPSALIRVLCQLFSISVKLIPIYNKLVLTLRGICQVFKQMKQCVIDMPFDRDVTHKKIRVLIG